MDKFHVVITESLCKTFLIEAGNEGEAIDIAREQHKNRELVLSHKDLSSVDFDIY